MTAPAWLIAAREFRAYTATASFWVALAIGPLAMAGALALVNMSQGSEAPTVVTVRAPNSQLAGWASAAIVEAGQLEGRRLAPTSSAKGPASLVLAQMADGDLDARFSEGFPLSASGRTLVARTMEEDELLYLVGNSGRRSPFAESVRGWRLRPPRIRIL